MPRRAWGVTGLLCVAIAAASCAVGGALNHRTADLVPEADAAGPEPVVVAPGTGTGRLEVSASWQFCTDYCTPPVVWRNRTLEFLDGDSTIVVAVTDRFGRAVFESVPQGAYMLLARCKWHGRLWYGPYDVVSNETRRVTVFHRCTGQYR